MRLLRTPLAAVCSLIGCMAMLVLAFSMPRGITPSYDSAIYFSMSHELLAGHGLSAWTPQGTIEPVTSFPPLFPLALAGMSVFGPDQQTAAKWLSVVLFGGTIFLAGFLVGAYTASLALGIFGSLLLLTAVPVLEVYVMAWTEPYFIVLMLVGLGLLSQYISNISRAPRRYPLLIGAGIFLGLAVLARYAGLALLGFIPCVFLLLDKRTLRQRLIDSVMCDFVASIPIGLWVVRNVLVAHSATGRAFGLELVTADNLRRGAWTVSAWVLSDQMPTLFKLIILVLLLVVFIGVSRLAIRVRNRRRDEADQIRTFERLADVLLIFIIVYPIFLLISISLFDHATPLDFRILSPLFVTVVLYTTCSVSDSLTLVPRRFSALLRAVAILFFCGYLIRDVQWTADLRANGTSFTAVAWQNSKIMDTLRALPSSTKIYTNGNEAVYLLTGRLSVDLPQIYGPVSSAYLDYIKRFRSQIDNTDCVIVFFDHPDFDYKKTIYLSKAEWEQSLALSEVLKDDTGTLYTLRANMLDSRFF